MPSPITTSGYSNFSITDVNVLFQEEMMKYPPDMVKTLYTQQPWKGGDPKRMTFDTYALPTFLRRVDENEAAPQLSVTEGDTLAKEFFKFAGVWDYTVEMKTFDKEDLITKFVENLRYAINNNIDHELTMQILSYANATTFTPLDYTNTHAITTPDGKAVGASDHNVNSSTSTNRSNIDTAASALNLDSLIALMGTGAQNTVDDASRVVTGLKFDTIVCANWPAMLKKIEEIFGSTLTPETNNNAANFFRVGAYGHMKVIALNHGMLNSQGNFDSTVSRKTYWSIMDSRMFGANKWATTGEAEVVPATNPKSPNALFSLMGYKFLTYGIVRWQGKAYSFSTTV